MAATNLPAPRPPIAVDEILRAAGTVAESDESEIAGSALLTNVVIPALARAEEALSAALARITIADLTQSAESQRKAGTQRQPGLVI